MDYPQIDIAAAVGTAVLHSLWQGAAVYCLFRLAAQQVERPARLHDLGLLSLGAIALGFALTLYLVWPDPRAVAMLGTGETFRLIPSVIPQHGPPADVPWAALLGYGYAIGVVVYLAWLTLEHVRTQRLLRSQRLALPVEWQAVFHLAHERFAPHVKAGFHLSAHVTTVVTVGLLRPVVLYPVALANQLSVAEAELILLHELAHLRRYDHLTVYVQQLLRALLFFHPAAHLLSRHIDTAREYACDDLVVTGTNRKAYAKTLLHLAAQPVQNHLTQPSNALAMSISKTPFTTRIQRLFGAPKTTKLPTTLFALPLVLFALALYAFAPASGEPVTATAERAPERASRVELKTDTVPVEVAPLTDAAADAPGREDQEAERIPTLSPLPPDASEAEVEAYVAEVMRNMPSEAELLAQVAEAMKSIPSEAEVAAMVAEAMKNMPSAAEISAQVEEAMKSMPTEAELKRTIAEAMKSIPTQAEIDRMVRETRASGLDEAELNRVQDAALRAQAEALRVQAEAVRTQDAVERTSAEIQRAQSEAQRNLDAAQRAQAEAQRAQSEAQRELDAIRRAQSEAQRAQSEAQRERERESRVRVTTEQHRVRTDTSTAAHSETRVTISGNSSKSAGINADLDARDIDYYINDRPATAEEVNALNPSTIERVDVTKTDGKRGTVRVYLKK